MQKNAMVIGQDYAKAYWKSQSLGRDSLYRVRLVRFDGGQGMFVTVNEETGRKFPKAEPEAISHQMVLGTWEDHLAALAEEEVRRTERNARQDAEVAERNAARAALCEMLGKDWAKDLPPGIDTPAKVHNDRSGVYGAEVGSSYRSTSFTTVDLLGVVKKAHEAGRRSMTVEGA